MIDKRVLWLLLWFAAMCAVAAPVALRWPDLLPLWWLCGAAGGALWLWVGRRNRSK